MMGVALTLFALAALGGATIAALRIGGTPRPPTWLALLHGAVALAGLGFMAAEIATTSLGTWAYVGVGVLALAALGGAVLFFGFHLQGKALPILLVLGHGLIALIGFTLLALYHYKAHEWGWRP
jgi:hypothetical protein